MRGASRRSSTVRTPVPLVSILLPAFNAASTLPACLRSVRRQSEPRWECVIVDDGSSDDTVACARSFARQDPRFVVVANTGRGLVTALNHGLANCQGRYVARMDADDVMHRERLTEQRRALDAAPRLAGVGCHVRLFPRSSLREGLRAYERWLNGIDGPRRVREEAYVECPIAHPTLMIRREVLVEFGYRDCGWPEDYDLILRLLGRGQMVGVVPRRLLCWRDGPQRLSRTGASYTLARFTGCKAAFLAETFLADTEDYVLWGYGGTGKALRRALLARGRHPSHIVELHPGRLGKTIHGAPVIRPEELPHVPRRPVVVSVAGEQPRREIREWMTAMGFREPDDFVCAA